MKNSGEPLTDFKAFQDFRMFVSDLTVFTIYRQNPVNLKKALFLLSILTSVLF